MPDIGAGHTLRLRDCLLFRGYLTMTHLAMTTTRQALVVR